MGLLHPDLIIFSASLAFLVSYLDEFRSLRRLGKPFSCPLCLGFWIAAIAEICNYWVHPNDVLLIGAAMNAFVSAPAALLLYHIIEKLEK